METEYRHPHRRFLSCACGQFELVAVPAARGSQRVSLRAHESVGRVKAGQAVTSCPRCRRLYPALTFDRLDVQ